MSNRYIFANKLKIQQLIDVVKDVHYKMTKKEYKNTLYHILRELYTCFQNADKETVERQYISDIISEMCSYVRGKCQATKSQILATWMKIALENQLTLNFFDMMVLEHLKQFFFGYLQTYQVIFEQKDRYTRQGRYYYVLKMEFIEDDGIETVKMYVSIEDLTQTHNNHTLQSIGLDFIPGSYIDELGFIVFHVSDTTLAGFAHFTYSCYNNHGFTGDFEVFPILTVTVSLHSMLLKYGKCLFLECNKSQELFNNYLASNHYNKKIFDIFVPF